MWNVTPHWVNLPHLQMREMRRIPFLKSQENFTFLKVANEFGCPDQHLSWPKVSGEPFFQLMPNAHFKIILKGDDFR